MYYDDIKDEKFLKCNIDINEENIPIISFEIVNIEGINFELTKNHFKRLDIFTFYIDRTKLRLLRYKKLVNSGTSEEELSILFSQEILSLKAEFGLNHYLVAFIEELSVKINNIYNNFLLE